MAFLFFFVLSGFLIGNILIRILQKEGATFKSLLNFWIKRWLRTLPAYFFVLILLIILSTLLTKNFNSSGLYKYFIFLQNFNNPPPQFFIEAWSLSVEEWFYLLIPLTMFLFIRIFNVSIKRIVLIIIFSIIILTIAFRFYQYSKDTLHINTLNDWLSLFKFQVITRLDSLMFGVLGAYGSNYHKLFWTKNKLILFLMGVLILLTQMICDLLHLFGFGLYQCVFSFTVIAIGGVFLLPFLSELKTGSGFMFKIITQISIISYSMYLLNYSVILCFLLKYINFKPISRILLISPVFFKYLLYWIFTIIGAHLLYKCVEKPLMDLRKNIKI